MKAKLSRLAKMRRAVYFYGMDMYFIALVAPEDIDYQVLKWKQWFKEKYGCQAALRSPAHITLVPPFWMDQLLEKNLAKSLAVFAGMQKEFGIQLENFSVFAPRVIFVDIMPGTELAKMRDDLFAFLAGDGQYPLKKDDRPFHPHITLATRDLHKKAFYEAWDYFKGKKYSAQWLAQSISLLKHNKKNWDIVHTSQF